MWVCVCLCVWVLRSYFSYFSGLFAARNGNPEWWRAASFLWFTRHDVGDAGTVRARLYTNRRRLADQKSAYREGGGHLNTQITSILRYSSESNRSAREVRSKTNIIMSSRRTQLGFDRGRRSPPSQTIRSFSASTRLFNFMAYTRMFYNLHLCFGPSSSNKQIARRNSRGGKNASRLIESSWFRC